MSRNNLRTLMRKIIAISASILGLTSLAAQAAADCAQENTLFSPCSGDVKVELVVLPSNDQTSPPNRRRITVTGTYSSGDRFGIEGLALKNGIAESKRFQRWDGGLLIHSNGTAQIVNVGSIKLNGISYNLRDTTQRASFLANAKRQKISFIQSHLLITNGALDTREVSGAPRFQRRILYADASGNISLYDSKNRALTLYEAALELHKNHGAHMAFNLDMGSYDFCEIETGDSSQSCGIIRSASDERLTNLLRFTFY